tara:strand:+ start:967 stop:1731 length:765 start_codon:yes stop_codon:yes gene_type:complete
MLLLRSLSRFPAFVALLAQVFASVIILFLIMGTPEQELSIFGWAIVQGMIAAIISYRLKMANWWILIHLIFMPALIATLSLSLPPLWFCILFLLLMLIYGKTYQTQVPLYLSSQEVTNALGPLLPRQRNFSFIDLGCGCGGLLKNISQVHSNGNYYGIEAAPLPYLVSKLRNIVFTPNCKIKWGDFWEHDLAHYDVVYAYLSPVPMESLWHKACQEMHPGSIFISNSFIIPGVLPERSLKLNDFSGSTLYLWRI